MNTPYKYIRRGLILTLAGCAVAAAVVALNAAVNGKRCDSKTPKSVITSGDNPGISCQEDPVCQASICIAFKYTGGIYPCGVCTNDAAYNCVSLPAWTVVQTSRSSMCNIGGSISSRQCICKAPEDPPYGSPTNITCNCIPPE